MNKTCFPHLLLVVTAAMTGTGLYSTSASAHVASNMLDIKAGIVPDRTLPVMYAQGTEREKNWEWYGTNYTRQPQGQDRAETQAYPNRTPQPRDPAYTPYRTQKERPWGEVPQGYQQEPYRDTPYGHPPAWEAPPVRDGYGYSPNRPPRGGGEEYRRDDPPYRAGGYYSPEPDPGYGDERRGRYDPRDRDHDREWSPPPASGRGYDDRYGSGAWPSRGESSGWGYGGNSWRQPGYDYPDYPGHEAGPGGWGDPFRWGRW
ncbi:MAG: hypothetical protein H7833_10340 [Magnetococcus sp. DMHC-1]|nr:hypothetical protein [Magnetococcales bacterium]